jgi:hypothetical protein
MPDPVADVPPAYGPVFNEIERRLRERYRISIRDHVGDVVIPDATGQLDPSLGGVIPSLGGPREQTIRGKTRKGRFFEGKTVLQGITFPPKNFQFLLELFRNVTNSRGEAAFHYHPLKPLPGGVMGNFLNKMEQVAFLDWLGLSYDQTTVGLTKASEQRAFGFREIADTYNTGISAAVRSAAPFAGANRFILKFGQEPSAYAREVDITSLHVALTPFACNIHIDNVGFVIRGQRSSVGLDPDFVQHLVNELVWKSILRDTLIEKYGEQSDAVWAVEHLGIMLPSSDRRYQPSAGLSLDVGSAQVTFAFTMGCKCLQKEKLTTEERLMQIPEGDSFGFGFRKDF